MLPRSCGIPQAREIFDSGGITHVPHSWDALTRAKSAKEYGDGHDAGAGQRVKVRMCERSLIRN